MNQTEFLPSNPYANKAEKVPTPYSEYQLDFTDKVIREFENFQPYEQNQLLALIKDKIVSRRKQQIQKMNEDMETLLKLTQEAEKG